MIKATELVGKAKLVISKEDVGFSANAYAISGVFAGEWLFDMYTPNSNIDYLLDQARYKMSKLGYPNITWEYGVS